MDFQEGTFLGKPPLFTGENYNYWKIHMTIFIKIIGVSSLENSGK